MAGTITMQGSETRERAGQAKDVAVDGAGQVASTAKEQAGQVAQEAKTQVGSLAGQAQDAVREQAVTQRDRLTQTLRTVGSDLGTMADNAGASSLTTDLVRQVSDRVNAFASSLDNREPGDLVVGVRDFARRRPGTFLLGAAVAGVVAGRVTRGARAAQSASSTNGSYASDYSSTPIGDSVQSSFATTGDTYASTTPGYPSPATTGGIGWTAAESDPGLGATNYGEPTTDVTRDVDLTEAGSATEWAPVAESSATDAYGDDLNRRDEYTEGFVDGADAAKGGTTR